ncbi:hypothetical protein FCULG_00000523 [Fusarium culmorum]|uniref:Uncharacterized protein n=1 Tax=Fusarium culmorum TaxID=5516 RepID=A0A2T4GJU2_FUSCU|nr:hypothetical protein FCULG_00000523 [Fusarium culmorum]
MRFYTTPVQIRVLSYASTSARSPDNPRLRLISKSIKLQHSSLGSNSNQPELESLIRIVGFSQTNPYQPIVWCGRPVKCLGSRKSKGIDKKSTILLSDMTDVVPSAAAQSDIRHELDGWPRKPS